MLTYNFHKNFQLPNLATRIRNLVALGKQAAVNVEPNCKCVIKVPIPRAARCGGEERHCAGFIRFDAFLTGHINDTSALFRI